MSGSAAMLLVALPHHPSSVPNISLFYSCHIVFVAFPPCLLPSFVLSSFLPSDRLSPPESFHFWMVLACLLG